MRFLPTFAFLLLPIARADSLEEVLGRMDRAAAEFKSFSAKMKRTDFTAVLNESTELNGSAVMRRTRNGIEALTQFSEPDAHAIYFNGRIAKRYYPKTNTVELYDAGKLASTADQMMLVGFGASSAELRKSYDIRLIGAESVASEKATRIELIPKSADTRKNYVTRIELWIPDGKANPVQEKVTKPSKDYYLVNYSDLKVNPPLPDAAFSLTLPAGVKEIRP